MNVHIQKAAEIRAGSSVPHPAPEKERVKIPERYRWDLTDICRDDSAWVLEKEKLKGDFSSIDIFPGKLADGPGTVLHCLELLSRIGKEYARLYCYASMRSDEDTRDSACLGMEQEISQMGSDLAARAAFLQPEILRIGRETIEQWIAGEPRLEVYRHNLDDVLRRMDHTGTEGEEKILATAGLIADGPHSIYSIFSDADFPFPETTLSNGTRVRLDKSAFSLHRAAPNREDRKRVFSLYFGKLGEFRRTFGTQLAAEVKKNIFFARSRRYASCLERALDGNNIPHAVYHGLIENVHAHIGTFHRYLRLRKRLLGVEELHSYDLYAPVVAEVDVEYSYDEACGHIIASLAPLGDAYVRVSRNALTERWVDVFPTEGKRSGAYSNGAVYDVHPFILMNYNGKYDDVSTLAHELGHTMHSHLTNTTQPYATSEYSIFVAEVASTFNEALLLEHMLKAITDDATRLSLLGHYLDGIRGTVFRQTQFAEFELRIHEQAERGEALTGDSLGALYDQINKTYYGHDGGVCVIEPEIRDEWTHIPHFFYNFYVFQYATSYTASAAFSEMVLAGDREMTRRYLELLSAGGSDYPVALLKKAGIDMTTSLPFELTMQKMSRVMDEMEKILDRRTASVSSGTAPQAG